MQHGILSSYKLVLYTYASHLTVVLGFATQASLRNRMLDDLRFEHVSSLNTPSRHQEDVKSAFDYAKQAMDALIHDLLAKRNYTQARKALEKKLKQKKFENNSSLLVRLS